MGWGENCHVSNSSLVYPEDVSVVFNNGGNCQVSDNGLTYLEDISVWFNNRWRVGQTARSAITA